MYQQIGPSAKQLAEIQALEKEIRSLQSQVRRPYSVLLSLGLGGLATYLLFKWGVLEWLDDQVGNFTADLWKNGIGRDDQCFQNLTNQQNDFLLEYTKEYERVCKQLSGDYFKKKYGLHENCWETLELAENDKNLKENEALLAKYANNLRAVNEKLCETVNIFFDNIKIYGDNASFVIRKMFKQDLSLGAAGQLKIFKENIDFLPQFLSMHRNTVCYFSDPPIWLRLYAYLLDYGYEALSKLSLTIGIDYFMTDRLLHKMVWKRVDLVQQDADKKIKMLRGYRQDLLLSARENVVYARYLLAILIVGFLLSFLLSVLLKVLLEDSSIENFLLTPEIIFLGATILATAMSNSIKDLQDWANAKQLEYKLNTKQNLIEKSLDRFGFKLSRIKNKTIASSYFELNILDLKIDGQTISQKKLASIFKECCFYYKIPIISRNSNFVYISANNSLNEEKAKKLNILFWATVKRDIQVRKLISQMKDIFTLIADPSGEWHNNPEYDGDHLPVANLKLCFSSAIDRDILSELKKLFGENSVTESEQEVAVNFRSSQPLEANKFHQARGQITRINRALCSQEQQELNNQDPPGLINRRSFSKLSKDESMEPVDSQSSKFVTRIIRWSSLEYNSETKNHHAHPVLFGKQEHSERSYLNARTFVIDKLDWSKIPQEIRAVVKAKVDNLKERAKFAGAKKGDQGFLNWNKYALDQNGQWFLAKAKGKILGNEGDMRVFCDEEIASTGERLLIIKGIELRAHKSPAYRNA